MQASRRGLSVPLLNNSDFGVGSYQMTPQYFITYNLKKGWNNNNSGPIIAANWNKASGAAADGDDIIPEADGLYPLAGWRKGKRRLRVMADEVFIAPEKNRLY